MRASQVVLVEEPACQGRKCKRYRFNPWVGKIPWRKKWQPTPVFLPGESHGKRSLVGYRPQGCKDADTTEVTQHAQMNENLEKDIFYLLLSSAFLHIKLAKIQKFYKLSVNVEGKSHCKGNISVTFLKGKLVVSSFRLIC